MMGKASFELPDELVAALQARCDNWGIASDELVAAVLLHHLERNSTKENPGWPFLDALDEWKQGPRSIRRWQAASLEGGATIEPSKDGRDGE